MTDIDAYQVTLSALSDEDGGGFLAEVFELPGCIADGETKEEALRSISDAIASWIAAAKAEGRDIPAPKLYTDEAPDRRFTTRMPRRIHSSHLYPPPQEYTKPI